MLRLLVLLAGSDTTGYWQQQVAYRITASLDEPSGVLTGRARIGYVNRSPDTLRDFSVHQYLNAFRPGSRWAAADSAEGLVRFQRLTDPEYAFERISRSIVMGRTLAPDYPYAPDSTIAHWTLPRPLAPGDSLSVEIDWHARLSTLPRRQGREGRRFDFAQWYPKVTVYDEYGWQDHPLYPAGEFYGEFASYDVTLDLPDDQVVGATGVPIEGDPGWERARAVPGLAIDYQRDWYHSPLPTLGCAAMTVAQGRKCVRLYAEDVHHFAFSLNPHYVYEEGRYGKVVIRVLYTPADRARWQNGIAVQRTAAALAWLDSLFGAFAWPQITNVDRIEEGGGTEFPMLMMNDSPDLGLIVHEAGHNYTMGILANNEWREGWLDEGFSDFQEAWFFERLGDPGRFLRSEVTVLAWELDGWSEPVSLAGDRFRDYETYRRMIYTKGMLFFRQLRYVVGEETMRRILRTYYARWKLKHVDEDAFRDVAEEVSGMDLKWLFGQWLHGTTLIDYRLKSVERRRLPPPDGQWRTTVTIERKGDGWMPVEIGDGDSIYARATGQPEVERVEFTSARRPGRLMLDPRVLAHDWNMLNNHEKRGVWGSGGRREWKLDNPTRETGRRDRLVSAVLPVAWFNDLGGVTLGVRTRDNYLGRYERRLMLGTVGLREAATHRLGAYFRWSNPVRHRIPRTELSAAAWAVEGRAGVALRVERSLRQHLAFGADPRVGFDAAWMATTDLGYLDRRLWDDAGTVEAGPWVSTATWKGAALVRARLAGRVGVLYWNPGTGVVSSDRYDAEAFGRATAEASVRAPFWGGTTLGLRAFAGGYLADSRSPPPRQRRIMVSGADPYETFGNPLLRSRGALLARPGFHYHAPGGANLRGFRGDLGGRWAAAVNVELTRSVLRRPPGGGILRDVALEAFADGGVVDSSAILSAPPGRAYTTLYDAGVGLVTRQALGDLDWTLRFELPLVVNRWDQAADSRSGGGDRRLAFRWQVSLEPTF